MNVFVGEPMSEEEKRGRAAAAAAAAQAKKQLPPWAKWVFLGFGIALVLGVAAWAFVTFYLNSLRSALPGLS